MQMLILVPAIMLLFWLTGACVLKWFSFMIQPGGALDILFDYRKFLNRLYNGNLRQQLLEKALGGCQMCMAFWFQPICFVCYYAFCRLVAHVWITAGIHNWFTIVFVNLVWYVVFHAVGATVTYFIMSKKID